MGICLNRDQDEYVGYDRYVYCETCLARMCFNGVYVMAHCLNKTHMFSSSACYERWVTEK